MLSSFIKNYCCWLKWVWGPCPLLLWLFSPCSTVLWMGKRSTVKPAFFTVWITCSSSVAPLDTTVIILALSAVSTSHVSIPDALSRWGFTDATHPAQLILVLKTRICFQFPCYTWYYGKLTEKCQYLPVERCRLRICPRKRSAYRSPVNRNLIRLDYGFTNFGSMVWMAVVVSWICFVIFRVSNFRLFFPLPIAIHIKYHHFAEIFASGDDPD